MLIGQIKSYASVFYLKKIFLRWHAKTLPSGRPCHSSKWLLTDVFRTELGCDKCLIGTDFRDIELLSDMNTANTSRYPGLPADTDASLQSLAAGVDQDLGGFSYNDLDIILDAPRALPPTPLSDSQCRAVWQMLRCPMFRADWCAFDGIVKIEASGSARCSRPRRRD